MAVAKAHMEIILNHHDKVKHAEELLNRIIVGKKHAVRLSLVCMLAGGHLLLEDIPGTGKTVLAKALAKIVDVSFVRIQFTPDLMPSDILGVSVYQPATQEFKLRKGPVFHNIVLADEINRGSPRTQSALLEAMAEHHVSIDGHTLPLPQPFMVIATQNPLDGVGTFPLPAAQKDRFLFSLQLGYPDPESEMALMQGKDRHSWVEGDGLRSLGAETWQTLSEQGKQVKISENLLQYMHRLVQATRNNKDIHLGLSTRAALALCDATRFYAFLEGRSYAIPEDVQHVFIPLAQHRIDVRDGGQRTKVLESILKETAV